jgi:hypothetical protein
MPKPFAKGDSRINRLGRPRKGQSMTEILGCVLDRKDETGKMRREKIAEKLILLAESGDIAALRYTFDRIDGRPTVREIVVNDTAVEKKLLEVFNDG